MSHQPGAILVVEDYADDATMLQTALEDAGVSNPVRIVHNAADAMSYLKRAVPFSDDAKFPAAGVVLLAAWFCSI